MVYEGNPRLLCDTRQLFRSGYAGGHTVNNTDVSRIVLDQVIEVLREVRIVVRSDRLTETLPKALV
jgi:hypothetical protein